MDNIEPFLYRTDCFLICSSCCNNLTGRFATAHPRERKRQTGMSLSQQNVPGLVKKGNLFAVDIILLLVGKVKAYCSRHTVQVMLLKQNRLAFKPQD